MHWQSEQILVSMKHLQQEIHQYQVPCLAPRNWLLLQTHHKQYEFHWQLYLILAYSAILLVSCEPLGPEIKVKCILYNLYSTITFDTKNTFKEMPRHSNVTSVQFANNLFHAGTTTCWLVITFVCFEAQQHLRLFRTM